MPDGPHPSGADLFHSLRKDAALRCCWWCSVLLEDGEAEAGWSIVNRMPVDMCTDRAGCEDRIRVLQEDDAFGWGTGARLHGRAVVTMRPDDRLL